MNNRVARTALIVSGAIAALVGAVFAGQGLGIIPGSVMTGDRFWFYVGVILAVVGVLLIVLGLRRPRK